MRQTEEDALMAEGLSTEFAETLLDSFRDNGLPVHPFNALRETSYATVVNGYRSHPLQPDSDAGAHGDLQLRKRTGSCPGQDRAYRQTVALALEKGNRPLLRAEKDGARVQDVRQGRRLKISSRACWNSGRLGLR